MVLKDKKIVLGVTGAVSAYKALELTRLLVKEGAGVYPVLTRAAREFITPLSISALARNEACTELFSLSEESRIGHIELAQGSDLIIVAPATANFIGKVASGLSDDLLSTVIMASKAPVLFAPSMNERMYENPIVQRNIERLRECGYFFVGPDEGELACGYSGKGRLASPEDILEAARECLSPKDLAGEKVLVTAGPTREAIDPVRFVSNASSGRTGYELARAAKRRGAEVVLISGPSYLEPPFGVTTVRVETAQQMYDACIKHFPQSTVVIMAAAVSDYRPLKTHPVKVKKDSGKLNVEMVRTKDILKELARRKGSKVLVGFALETEDHVENAKKKLREKMLDMVVANSPSGLASETNEVALIDGSMEVEVLPTLEKTELAERILDRIAALRCGKSSKKPRR